jgi:small-conductance mechanosensitive channel
MLNRTMYESLPYVYCLTGAGLIIFVKQGLVSVLGGLLFLIGGVIWNLRSEYRRKDNARSRKKDEQNKFFYNMKPFVLLLLSCYSFTFLNSNLIHFFTMTVALMAVWILYLRVMNRHSAVTYYRHR